MISNGLSKPQKPHPRSWWSAPFLWLEWSMEWIAYWLSTLALLQILEYAGKLTVLVAVIFYFAEAPERQRRVEYEKKRTHYEAWQLINSAQGQGASGGRIDALQDLNRDKVSLGGLTADNAYLPFIDLKGAQLQQANFQKSLLLQANLEDALLPYANLREAVLVNANLQNANVHHANLQSANLSGANLRGIALVSSNLQSANLGGTNLQDADLEAADLRDALLQGADFTNADFRKAVNLTIEQIRSGRNWEKAIYDDNVRIQLGLPQTTSQSR